MDAIAEDIETKFEAGMLRHHGTDYGQGYHYSKALPIETLIKLISGRLSR